MGLRTITAPGIEIKEIDKSQYAPAMTGTKCFVMGYSDKGTPYEPMEFTSKNAWQLYYGDPDNEAERYFYNACSEVINQNGVLYCARIPYDNEAFGKMVGFKYTVEQNDLKDLFTSATAVSAHISSIVHNADFEHDAVQYAVDNLMGKVYIYNDPDDPTAVSVSYGEVDEEVQRFYTYANRKYKDCDNDQYKIRYYKAENAKFDSKNCLSTRWTTKAKVKAWMKTKEEENTVHDLSAGTHSKLVWSNIFNINNDQYVIGKRYVEMPKIETYNQLSDLDVANGKTFGSLSNEPEISNVLGYKLDISKVDISSVSPELCTLYTSYGYEIPLSALRDTITNGKTSELSSNGETNILKILLASIHNDEYLCLSDYGYGSLSDFEVFKYINSDVYQSNDGKSYEVLVNEPLSSLALNNPILKDDDYIKICYNEIYTGYYDMPLWKICAYTCKAADELKIQGKSEGTVIEWIPKPKDWLTPDDIRFRNANELFMYYATHITDVDKLVDVYGFNEALLPEYYGLRDVDNSIDKYMRITQGSCPSLYDLDKIDEYRTGEDKVPNGTFIIFDKTCATLNNISEDDRKGEKRNLIGIFPVVTTAANGLQAQSMINVRKSLINQYESIRGAHTKPTNEFDITTTQELRTTDIVKDFYNTVKGEQIDTVSLEANTYFPGIQMNEEGTGLDTDNLKKIGVVIYKAYLDASEGNKVNFMPVEAFAGSLDPKGKDPNTGASTFIDKIVNSNSQYIYLASNCFGTKTAKAKLNDADLFIIEPAKTGMLGFYEHETVEEISLTSLYGGIDKCLKNVESIDERDIDIIPDAGLANIAQYMKSVWDGSGPHKYGIDEVDSDGNPLINYWKCQAREDVSAWKTVLFKLDNFCKNVRKDCMFIADGPRPMVLQGEKKIVRSTKPSNTIDANILPYVKWATGLNTNYGAGYLDWFQVTDEFTGDEFWCPPSIKAMGVYINTDLNFNYWDAPAGLNRGVIAALDTAFSPTNKQAGSIYEKNWNYAINYPYDGIVLEGQKTFQVKPSALDRVNVRRLALRLERQCYKILRYFVYEGNTAYTRQRVVDLLNPAFSQCKVGGGLYDYKIICDESNNTPESIDRNELHIKIGIKPVKTIEFIMVDFVFLSTGADWSEL